MSDNIFTVIHYMLISEIDGPAADVFSTQVAPLIGDIKNINQRVNQLTQLHWLAMYWVQQIANSSKPYLMNVNNLLVCRNIDEFTKVFRATVMPLILTGENIPHFNVALLPLDAYTQPGA